MRPTGLPNAVLVTSDSSLKNNSWLRARLNCKPSLNRSNKLRALEQDRQDWDQQHARSQAEWQSTEQQLHVQREELQPHRLSSIAHRPNGPPLNKAKNSCWPRSSPRQSRLLPMAPPSASSFCNRQSVSDSRARTRATGERAGCDTSGVGE